MPHAFVGMREMPGHYSRVLLVALKGRSKPDDGLCYTSSGFTTLLLIIKTQGGGTLAALAMPYPGLPC